jgi:hypothetical protein
MYKTPFAYEGLLVRISVFVSEIRPAHLLVAYVTPWSFLTDSDKFLKEDLAEIRKYEQMYALMINLKGRVVERRTAVRSLVFLAL